MAFQTACQTVSLRNTASKAMATRMLGKGPERVEAKSVGKGVMYVGGLEVQNLVEMRSRAGLSALLHFRGSP